MPPFGQCLAGLDVGVATRRADKPRPSCTHSHPYPHGVVLVFASPFPFFLERAEHRATLAARRSPRWCRFRPSIAAPLRFLAPQLHSLAPHPRRPFTSSSESSRGRIGPSLVGRHCHPRRSSAPHADDLLPASLRSNRVAGELLRALLSLPDHFPGRISRHRRR